MATTTTLADLRQDVADWSAAALAGHESDEVRQPNLEFVPSKTVTKMAAAVSPDCSYRLVEAAVDAAEDEIWLYIYNVSADHLLDLLRAAKARGVAIRLMYDATDTRGDERAKLEALGVELKVAPSTGQRRVFPHCHQKFAVIDGKVLLLGSANWAKTSIPFVTAPGVFRKGNREWLIRIDDVPLATWFKGLFTADWEIPELPAPPGLAELFSPPPDGTVVPALLVDPPAQVFDIKQVDLGMPTRVTPIVSPDNYFDLMVQLIAEATDSIDVEQQYILIGGPRTEEMLAALAARKDELTIRIIVSPAFRKVGKLDNWELSVRSLAAFGLAERLRAMNLNSFTHLHNKGVIVDRRQVVVASTNWSENSVARAREAGVLVESPEVAGYYAEVFDLDWDMAWDPDDVPANVLQAFSDAMFVPGGFTDLHPADLL